MQTVLMTAYDINPYKGSESGMGWHFVFQASRHLRVIAVTRENNRANIERYCRERSIDTSQLEFLYFDLPLWVRFWKRGSRGSSLYFYLWQLFMPTFVRSSAVTFDIAHNLNFHADAFPTFLWRLGKPLVWGPINHHEKIDSRFLSVYGPAAYIRNRLNWLAKRLLWLFDPFGRMARRRASVILAGNSSVGMRLRLDNRKTVLFSSVGSEAVDERPASDHRGFTILSVGRFVPLKGFDVAILSFIAFLKQNPQARDEARLVLIGQGPCKAQLMALAGGWESNIEFVDWVERGELSSYYEKASVFLFPSHEGAGMVVAEAMSHGLPLVCFDNYGPGELTDSHCALRVPYGGYDGTIEQFSAHLGYLYATPGVVDEMSAAALARFNSLLCWSRKGEALAQIYRSLQPVDGVT